MFDTRYYAREEGPRGIENNIIIYSTKNTVCAHQRKTSLL